MYVEQKVQLKLLDIICQAVGTGDEVELLTKERVAPLIFDASDVKPEYLFKKLSTLLSDLTRWLENFFGCQTNENHSFSRSLFMYEVYTNRGLDNAAERCLKRARSQADRCKNTFWSELKLFVVNYLLYFESKKDIHTLSAELLSNGSQKIDQFYVKAKLKCAIELDQRNKLLQEKSEAKLPEATINLLTEQVGFAEETISLYYLLYQLSNLNEGEVLPQFEKQVKAFTTIDTQLRQDFLIYAANAYAKAIRNFSDKDPFARKVFALYQFGINNELFIANGSFPPLPFKNIVNLGCKLGHLNRTHRFVREQRRYLPKDRRKALGNLCLATVHFWKKQYREAIRFIKKAHMENDYLKVELKILHTRCLYELYMAGEASEKEDKLMQSTERACRSLKNYLTEKKLLGDDYGMGSLRFVQILRKLLSSPNDPKIKDMIEDTKPLHCKDWLIEKYNL